MRPGVKLSLLFAAYMAGGNATILQNLQSAIDPRGDVESAWLPVEMDEESKVWGRHARRRSLLPGTVRNSRVAGEHIRRLEQERGRFDAAYYFQHTICLFLWRFRHRVPYVLAMDGTPLWYARHGLWYAQPRFDPDSLSSRVKQALVREVYQRAFHLFPLSRGVRDSLVEDYGVPPERITVLPPGIDLKRYVAPDRSASAVPGRPLRVLFVGADFVRKGGDLVTALAQRPEFRDVEFHVVTKSFEGPTPPNLRVHADKQTNTRPMVQAFEEADVFLLPTRADSHSIASLEAMAMALPVITTPTGGIVDVVEEGVTGYLVPPGDLEALADRLSRLRADPSLRVRMGLAGRRRVEERFDSARIAATVVEVMKRAVAERRGAASRA
jgi:glycosyltransferase involved in cell wall biosynthesis